MTPEERDETQQLIRAWEFLVKHAPEDTILVNTHALGSGAKAMQMLLDHAIALQGALEAKPEELGKLLDKGLMAALVKARKIIEDLVWSAEDARELWTPSDMRRHCKAWNDAREFIKQQEKIDASS